MPLPKAPLRQEKPKSRWRQILSDTIKHIFR